MDPDSYISNFFSAAFEWTNFFKKPLKSISTKTQKETEMLKEILTFHDKTASEIMTPRMDVNDVDISMTFQEVLKIIIESGNSRIPVYTDTQDNINGILYGKDLFPAIESPDNFCWQKVIRPAYFVSESKKIDELLEEFRANKIHMAIVVDEYGGTAGIITMEDILEEIVGEIADEYDTDEKRYTPEADGSFIFEAKILLNDFYRAIHLDDASVFDELTDEVDTLGGLILELKRGFPKKNEVITFKGYQFKVLEVDSRRIHKIHVSLAATPNA